MRFGSTSGLEERLARLEAEVQLLRQLVSVGRQTGIVDFGFLQVFMYVDDLSYQQTAEKYKKPRPATEERDLSQPRCSPQERYANPREPLLAFLLSHLWVHDVDFSFFDIGCQYGTSAMATGQIILQSQRSNPIYAFDPGVAGELAEWNILLNRMERLVRYERLAVGASTKPMLVFTELGHSENNRIVNPVAGEIGRSYVVGCTSVDEYVASHNIGGNLFLKIDTQGGEVEVFRGMERAMRERLCVCITEFTPNALATQVNPARWLEALAERFEVYDLGDLDIHLYPGHLVRRIDLKQIAYFTEAVSTSPRAYTDLLLLPKELPGLDTLRQRLTTVAS
jgi:FkbM family methyltransferase